MDVEQRIGRIHRYGQVHTAQVYNLVSADTIEGQIYLLLEEKLQEHGAVPDTLALLRSLQELGKKNPQLALSDPAFADHITAFFPEEPPSAPKDLREITKLARSALAQAQAI